MTKQEIGYCSLTEVGVFTGQEEELASDTTYEASILFILIVEVFRKLLSFFTQRLKTSSGSPLKAQAASGHPCKVHRHRLFALPSHLPQKRPVQT